MADDQHDQPAGDLPAELARPARRALAAAGYAAGAAHPDQRGRAWAVARDGT